MKVIEATTYKEEDHSVVSLRFKSIDQLLDPDDPTPLPKKELTQDAEDSILDNLFAFGWKKPAVLEVQLPGSDDPGQAAEIAEAIRHHFRFVLTEHARDTGIFIRERRAALTLTVINLVIGALFVVFLYENESWMNSLAGIVIGLIIIIMNWATIWDTYEFFIFDGRQRMHRRKLLQKLIREEIRVVPVAKED